jgi:hypothetical protein
VKGTLGELPLLAIFVRRITEAFAIGWPSVVVTVPLSRSTGALFTSASRDSSAAQTNAQNINTTFIDPTFGREKVVTW